MPHRTGTASEKERALLQRSMMRRVRYSREITMSAARRAAIRLVMSGEVAQGELVPIRAAVSIGHLTVERLEPTDCCANMY